MTEIPITNKNEPSIRAIDAAKELLEDNGYYVEEISTASDTDMYDDYPNGNVAIKFTGSIQDAELAEALEEAYTKHGPKLASYIRELCLYPKPVVLPF